jgi:hypothetical protein
MYTYIINLSLFAEIFSNIIYIHIYIYIYIVLFHIHIYIHSRSEEILSYIECKLFFGATSLVKLARTSIVKCREGHGHGHAWSKSLFEKRPPWLSNLCDSVPWLHFGGLWL